MNVFPDYVFSSLLFFSVQIGKKMYPHFFFFFLGKKYKRSLTLCVCLVSMAQRLWGFWVRDIVESFFGDFFDFLSLPLNFNRGGYTKHLSDISFSLVREK